MSLFLGKHEYVKAKKRDCTIKSIKSYVFDDKKLEESSGGGADCHAQSSGHWILDTPISTPMSIYEIYKSSRKLWGIDAIGSMIVEIELYGKDTTKNDNSNIKGYGISIGGEPGCFIVEKHFSRFIEGQDIHNIELMWDQMWRSSVNYGRKGLTIQALSAIDLALWDCFGKYKKEPVYNLLGGKTKERLPVYATTVRPDIAQKLGFIGAKIPLPYGPSDGDQGLINNIKRIQECCKSIKKPNKLKSEKINNNSARDINNETFPLMIDCYMSLTVPYTINLINKINTEIILNKLEYGHVNIKWIEEFLPPDDYNGYSKIYNYIKSSGNNISSLLLTCGEHEYTRYGFHQLLEKGCIDILQPDITWMGGITEAKKIISLASCYNIPIIPHGSSIYSYHLQIVYPNCPIAEFLMLSPNADKIQPLFGNVFLDEPLPKNGYIELDENKYGFGVTLNPELKLRRPYKHDNWNNKNVRIKTSINSNNWLNRYNKGPAKLCSML